MECILLSPIVVGLVLLFHASIGWMTVKEFNNPREAYRFCNYLNGGNGDAWDGE